MLLRISQVPNCFHSVVLAWLFTHFACLGRLKKGISGELWAEKKGKCIYGIFCNIPYSTYFNRKVFPEAVVQDLHFKNWNLLCDIVSTLQVILWSLHAQCTASWNIFGNKILDVCDVVLLVLEWYPFLCTVVFFSCSYYEDLHI